MACGGIGVGTGGGVGCGGTGVGTGGGVACGGTGVGTGVGVGCGSIVGVVVAAAGNTEREIMMTMAVVV